MTTKHYAWIASLLFFFVTTISIGTITVNTFTGGTPISASNMNANFTTIKTTIEELETIMWTQ